MNLLLLTKVYFPDNGGGISQAVMSLADCFRGQKEEILVCRPGQKEPVMEDSYDGVKVIRCRQFMDVFSTPLSFELLRQWKQRTDENTISVYNFPYPLGDLGILFHCYRGKLVVWWHCDFVSYKKLAPLYRPLVKHTLKKADAILVSSDGTIDGSDLLSQFRQKCVKVPYVVPEEYLKLGQEYMEARKANGKTALETVGDTQEVDKADTQTVHLLFMGRLVWYKGVEELLRVMKRLADEASTQAIRYDLTFVGGGFKEEEYKAYAQELGLNVVDDPDADGNAGSTGTVRFLGYVSEEEKIAAIKASDFLVMPSTSEAESFGIVQIEAMAFGKPVINTKLKSGVPDVSINDETGITIPPGDEDALYKAIKILGESPQLIAKYGRAAYERVRQHYTKEVMERITSMAFEEILKK